MVNTARSDIMDNESFPLAKCDDGSSSVRSAPFYSVTSSIKSKQQSEYRNFKSNRKRSEKIKDHMRIGSVVARSVHSFGDHSDVLSSYSSQSSGAITLQQGNLPAAKTKQQHALQATK